MSQLIETNCVVALRYIMRNSKGETLENTIQSSPVNYLHGSAGILPLLQKQLEGLERGDKKKVQLSKESGADDNFSFDVIIDEVRAAFPEEIILGYPLQVTINTCGDDCDCYE